MITDTKPRNHQEADRIARGVPPGECIITVRMPRDARREMKKLAHGQEMSVNEFCLRKLGLMEQQPEYAI